MSKDILHRMEISDRIYRIDCRFMETQSFDTTADTSLISRKIISEDLPALLRSTAGKPLMTDPHSNSVCCCFERTKQRNDRQPDRSRPSSQEARAAAVAAYGAAAQPASSARA